MEEDLQYKIAIGLVPGIGVSLTKNLIAYLGGVRNIFNASETKLQKVPGIGRVLAHAIAHANVLDRAEQELAFVERYKLKTYFYLDNEYPKRLKACPDAPVVFYLKGEVDLDRPKIISIVGTRNASDYGRELCEKLISDLAVHHPDVLVISGLAYGIDICAHRAALKNSLDTVAVLGNGLDMVYPSAHRNVAKDIIGKGALISEFLSGTEPLRENFLKRNRIVAGLADATVLVESAEKGGALVTADIAASYGRDVLAYPGRLTDKFSAGCNWLIKNNKAALFMGYQDLESALGWQSVVNSAVKRPVQKQLFVELKPEEEGISAYLANNGEQAIDDICRNTQMPTSQVSACLLRLEFLGMIKVLPGKRYKLI